MAYHLASESDATPRGLLLSRPLATSCSAKGVRRQQRHPIRQYQIPTISLVFASFPPEQRARDSDIIRFRHRFASSESKRCDFIEISSLRSFGFV